MKADTARARRAPAKSNGSAEFFFATGALYADKDELVSKKLVFTIKAIEFQESRGFEGADRWAITVSVNDGRPDEIITLQSNDERDAELQSAAAHIEDHGPIGNTILVKSGKAYYFRKTEAEPTA